MSQFPPTEGQMALKPHRGAMILVFGILSFIICFLFGVVAWMMANKDLREMDAGIMDPNGRGLTQAGKILGIIAAILNLIWVGFVAIIIIGALFAGAAAAAGAAGSGSLP